MSLVRYSYTILIISIKSELIINFINRKPKAILIKKSKRINTMTNKKYILPGLIISIGLAWLLNNMSLLPNIEWIWVIVSAYAGIMCLSVSKINKVTAVAGPLLIIHSIMSFLRQNGIIKLEIELPLMIIVLGFLMLISEKKNLPMPDFEESSQENKI